MCCPQVGFLKKLGRSVGKFFFFFFNNFFKKHPKGPKILIIFLKSTQKGQIWVHIPSFFSKNTQSEQNWVLSRPYIFFFLFLNTVGRWGQHHIFFSWPKDHFFPYKKTLHTTLISHFWDQKLCKTLAFSRAFPYTYYLTHKVYTLHTTQLA